jgi:hypothetical protein
VTNGDWPAPEPHEERPRLPLPRVDDLPVAEQGYDREAVQEAFDAFYRHAAQLDATLRTLEAVDVFQRTASELRAEMRTIRAGGWTVSSYGRGYGGGRGGGSGVREWSLPPAFPRIAAEALFLIVIGIVVGVAGWSRIAIVLVMGLALALVWLVELVASRERAVPRTAVAPPTAPKLDEEPAELTAGEAAAPPEEGPEAMTILGAAEPASAEAEETAEPEPEAEPEPVLEPESEAFPAAAEPELEAEPDPARAEAEEPEREPEPPPEVQVPPPSPVVAPGGAPPIPAPVPPATDEPEPTAAEAGLAAAAVDAGDEINEAPEAERAEEFVAQSHKVDAAGEIEAEEPLEAAAERPEPRAEELVAQSHKVGSPAADVAAEDADAAGGEEEEDTLSGIPAVSAAPPARRRFGFFRRRGKDMAEAEAVSAPPAGVAADEPAVADPWVLPPSERAADQYGAEAEQLDPWEQGPQLAAVVAAAAQEEDEQEEPEPDDEPQPLELIVEPEAEPLLEPEVEPEPVELVVASEREPDEQPEPEPAPAVSELPVDVLAEQAATSIDRSRARRRAPRRARRR